MRMPKEIMSMYEGKVCDFCPFGNSRLIVKYGISKEGKKYPTVTRCQAGYERNEQDTVFIETEPNKKQTFVSRPKICIDNNGV